MNLINYERTELATSDNLKYKRNYLAYLMFSVIQTIPCWGMTASEMPSPSERDNQTFSLTFSISEKYLWKLTLTTGETANASWANRLISEILTNDDVQIAYMTQVYGAITYNSQNITEAKARCCIDRYYTEGQYECVFWGTVSATEACFGDLTLQNKKTDIDTAIIASSMVDAFDPNGAALGIGSSVSVSGDKVVAHDPIVTLGNNLIGTGQGAIQTCANYTARSKYLVDGVSYIALKKNILVPAPA